MSLCLCGETVLVAEVAHAGQDHGMAVFAGEHGLHVIRKLIPQAHAALGSGGYLVMEIMSGFEEVHAVPDLAGISRVVVGRKS